MTQQSDTTGTSTQKGNDNDDEGVASASTYACDHESVIKRLEEVASLDYPYPIPERVKAKKGSGAKHEHHINLTSFKNLSPLFRSIGLFLLNTACPPLTLVFLLLGVWLQYYWDGDDSSSYASYSHSKVAFSLAIVCFFRSLSDSFLVHYTTDGKYGGLGCGASASNTNSNNNNSSNTNNTADAATTAAKEGFFCNTSNSLNARIKNRLGRFVNYVPTPYLYSGDLLTLGPFLLFKGSGGGRLGNSRVNYKRYWVKVPAAPAPDGEDGPFKKANNDDDDDDDNNNEQNEAVALDICFPTNGYQSDKATFLILHGLNGGSTEPYVLDLARCATREGHTLAVVINRGLMKTPVRGDVTFHGARTSDVGCAVDALHYALYGKGCRTRTTTTTDTNADADANTIKSKIVMVGFSMGGIIVANYAAKSKHHSGLAGALSFSGTLCTARNLLDCPAARHSTDIWQTPLAWGLKASIFKPSMHKFVKKGITVQNVEDVQSVREIDTQLVCKYHGYPTVYDYYKDMSAGGLGDEHGLQRLNNTRIPLLAVHAIDDPITIYEVTLAEHVDQTDNVMLLATKHGGHIGWPTGWFPSQNRWKFMMDISMEYAAEVVQ